MKYTEEITQEAIDTFINGHDSMERIVDVEYKFNESKIKVYYRNEKDQKCEHWDNFYPFLWAKTSVCRKMCDGDRRLLKMKLMEYGISVKGLRFDDDYGVPISEMQNGYTVMFTANRPMSQQRFNSFFNAVGCPLKKRKKKKGNEEAEIEINNDYLTVSSIQQYLISTGKRFFKGYDDYDQILRCIFDLECEGLDPKRHRITQVGIRFNRPFPQCPQGFEKIFDIMGKTKEEKDRNELKAIETMIKVIYTFKPDLITAHNGENFDWSFIIERCIQLGTTLEKVSAPYFHGDFIHKENFMTSLKLGGEVEKFRRTVVPGVIVTDSLHAVRRAMATDSSFPKADLKSATRYLDIKKKNRVYTPGNEISSIWWDWEKHYAFNDANGDWYLYDPTAPDTKKDEFKLGKIGDKPFVKYTRNYIADGYTLVTGYFIVTRYLLDDLWECDKVESALNSTDFMLSKILPLPYGKVVTMGTAGQWKALMLAWSYEHNLAIPDAPNTGSFTGGLSRLLCTGYVSNVVKLDYNSLYPSIILTWAIKDQKDLTNVMLHLLEYVLTTRETHKKLKKAANKLVDAYEDRINAGENLSVEEMDEYRRQCNIFKVEDNRQASVKKLSNSYFGAFGSNNGKVYPWKSPVCAERTTCTGRMALRLMISHFHDLGYQPIVGDTDGFNFKLPDESLYRYTKENPYIGKGLSRETKKDAKYVGFEADVAEFNDTYMCDMHYATDAINKMGLGIDEVVSATINFSRKNYADYFPNKPYPADVKMVGNTIKSKKMPEYIAKFLSKGIRLLLQNKGQEFLDLYYDEVDKIYNCHIPFQDIATKGKVKKTIEEYLEDCKTLTAAGRPKSRQAWMELAIKEGLKVDMGDTIYYINTGTKKGDTDCSRKTHYYSSESGMFGERVEITKDIDKGWSKAKATMEFKDKTKDDFIAAKFPTAIKEDEIILNCKLLPREVVENEEDVFKVEGIEYNVVKYLDMFNKRITPLLVCFSKDIRSKILIDNPSKREYFTKKQTMLVSGEPNKPGDQDTYEQLMTMEDKEIRFWASHPEFKIPYLAECKMNWEEIYNDYCHRMEEDKQKGIDLIKNDFYKAISEMSNSEYNDFLEDGKIPNSIAKIVEYNPETNSFMSKVFPDIIIGKITDIIDRITQESIDEDIPEEGEQSAS